MKITRRLLEETINNGLLNSEQAEQLWSFWTERTSHQASFRFTHILYYLGGLIAIGAMILFMALGQEVLGGFALLVITIVYAVLAILLTQRLLKRGLIIPAGITATFVVILTPVAVVSLLLEFGLWDKIQPFHIHQTMIDLRLVLIEIATLAVGMITVWYYRLPFIVMPIALSLWFLSMNLLPFFFEQEEYFWALDNPTALWSGLGMMLLAFYVDIRSRGHKDFAFWFYLVGVLSFWSGLTGALFLDQELGKIFYLGINIGLIIIGAILTRRVFVIFGACGVYAYLGHLAYSVFKDSILFPFALTCIGLVVIYLGLVWQQHEKKINHYLRIFLPVSIRELINQRN